MSARITKRFYGRLICKETIVMNRWLKESSNINSYSTDSVNDVLYMRRTFEYLNSPRNKLSRL